MVIRFLLAFSILIAISSCSIKSGKLKTAALGTLKESVLPKGLAPQIIRAEIEEMQPLFESANVFCENVNECPEAVGFVLAKFADESESGIIQCTGFLIDSETLVTNSHCVPDSLRKAGSDCENVIEVLFPEAGGKPAVRGGCKTILHAEVLPEDNDDPFCTRDYAVLKLEKPVAGRVPFAISRNGIASDLELHSFAVDPVSSQSPVGRLKKRVCMSMQGVQLVPRFNDSFAPVAAIVGCDLVQGNSGSPLLDNSGHVRGLLFAGADSEMILESLEKKASDSSQYVSVNAIMNSACLELPGQFGSRLPECDLPREPIAEAKLKQMNTHDLPSKFIEWQKNVDVRFLFIKNSSVTPATRLVPALPLEEPSIECVQPLQRWPIQDFMPAIFIKMEIPQWSVQIRYDQFTRPSFVVAESALIEAKFSLDRSQLQASQLGPVAVSTRNLKSLMPVTTNAETQFKICL